MAIPLELEGKCKLDGAWYDCEISWDKGSLKAGQPLMRVHFCGFGKDEDELHDNYEELKKHVRPRSTPAEDYHCKDIKEGDVTLTLQRRRGLGERKYFDAEVRKISRTEHTGEEPCNCTFSMRWVDGSKEGAYAKLHITSLCILSSRQVEDHPLLLDAQKRWAEQGKGTPLHDASAKGKGVASADKSSAKVERSQQNGSAGPSRKRAHSPEGSLTTEEVKLPQVSSKGRVIKQKAQVDLGDLSSRKPRGSAGKISRAISPAGPSSGKATFESDALQLAPAADKSQAGKGGTIRVESFGTGGAVCGKCGEPEDEGIIVTVNKGEKLANHAKPLCLDCFISSQTTYVDPSEFVLHIKNLKLALITAQRLSVLESLPKAAPSPQPQPQPTPLGIPQLLALAASPVPTHMTPSQFVTPSASQHVPSHTTPASFMTATTRFASPLQPTAQSTPTVDEAGTSGAGAATGTKMRLKDLARHKAVEPAVEVNKNVEQAAEATDAVAQSDVAAAGQQDQTLPETGLTLADKEKAGDSIIDQDPQPLNEMEVTPAVPENPAPATTGAEPTPSQAGGDVTDNDGVGPMETTGEENLATQEMEQTVNGVGTPNGTGIQPVEVLEDSMEDLSPGLAAVIKELVGPATAGVAAVTEDPVPPVGATISTEVDIGAVPSEIANPQPEGELLVDQSEAELKEGEPLAEAQMDSVEKVQALDAEGSKEQAKEDVDLSVPHFQVEDGLGLDLGALDVSTTAPAGEDAGSMAVELPKEDGGVVSTNEIVVPAGELLVTETPGSGTGLEEVGMKRPFSANGIESTAEERESKRLKVSEPVAAEQGESPVV